MHLRINVSGRKSVGLAKERRKLGLGNMDALKHLGLRPSKKIKLYNGPTECRLAKFELYSGSRKKG